VNFSLSLAQKTHSRAARHENKKNALATLVLEFFSNPNSAVRNLKSKK
jgi:hypothetical protein